LHCLYPNDGSATKGEKESADSDQHEHVEALKTALLRLFKVHVLDAIVFHITIGDRRGLCDGACIVPWSNYSPPYVRDCHLAMFFVDLVKDYADVLVQFPKECLCRTLALRKRAAPIDMNMSRTRLSAGNGGNNWVANQRMQGKFQFPSPIPTPLRLCNQHQSRTLFPFLHLRSHNLFTPALALHFRW